MKLSEPISTRPSAEQFRGGTGGVFFEHHTLLWKDAALSIELKKLPGGLKRKIAGLDGFLTQVRGPGRIAFSHDSSRA